MKSISHRQAKNLIQATMGGSIGQPEKDSLGQHLTTCANCREYTSQMAALEDGLRGNFHARWDRVRGPSMPIMDTIYKKSKAHLRQRKLLVFTKAAVALGLLIAISLIVVAYLPPQQEPLVAAQFTPTQEILFPTGTPVKTIIEYGQGKCARRTEIVPYTVQPGDTIHIIAEEYCLKPDTIYRLNYNLLIRNDNTLQPGLVIDIPTIDGIEVWVPPAYGLDAASPSQLGSGACQEPVSSFEGTGSFIWPTSLHYTSGEDYAPDLYQYGIDLAGSSVDPVTASDGGVVVFAGWSTWGYGNLVVIDHGNGKLSLYGHLSEVNVICGQQLEQGSPIGKIGATGATIGSALHFEIMVNNEHVNPHDYLPPP
jgi:hypothetical protein